MVPIQAGCEMFNINIFFKDGGEERFENVIDISLNGYFATILTLEGGCMIDSSKINSIHIFSPNKEFDSLFDI